MKGMLSNMLDLCLWSLWTTYTNLVNSLFFGLEKVALSVERI